MAVEYRPFSARVSPCGFGENNRMPIGRMDFCRKVERRKVCGQRDRGSAAVVRIGRIGGDRLDRQELEEPGETIVTFRVNASQDLIKIGHELAFRWGELCRC